jgi:hypothetical protein
VAQATEGCSLEGTTQAPLVTAASLDKLCTGFQGYVAADKQTAPAELAPALTSATSIAKALPTGTTGSGGSNGGSGATGGTSAASRPMGASFTAMVGMTGFAAVVLATAASF